MGNDGKILFFTVRFFMRDANSVWVCVPTIFHIFSSVFLCTCTFFLLVCMMDLSKEKLLVCHQKNKEKMNIRKIDLANKKKKKKRK